MDLFIVDAFTDKCFAGNTAGVVIYTEKDNIDKNYMLNLAAELRYSETAFIKKTGEKNYSVRFFTPVSEVNLCGHATIASFEVLKQFDKLTPGTICTMDSNAGKLPIYIENDRVMMEQATPKEGKILDSSEILESLAQALGINPELIGDQNYNNLKPQLISTGLWDILVPLKTKKSLIELKPNYKKISEITKKFDAVSLHVFTLDISDAIANCRDFAPLYGINEESATGTANGALTYYLYKHNVIKDINRPNLILQGESLNRPSKIYARILENPIKILVGGPACIISKGTLFV
ncbi:MAG: PhzF family phenazine biosynthesis protein [Thermoanaerobacteraceae bacterium]